MIKHETDIAITGIGVISPLGIGTESFWENCKNANSALSKINAFDTSHWRSNTAGMVTGFDPKKYMPAMTYRRMSNISRMAVAASVDALKDSGISLEDMDRNRISIIMGTADGCNSHVEKFYMSLLEEGPRGTQPFYFPETVPNAPASHIAMFHSITGPNTTFSQNMISAENAILFAKNLLLLGQTDMVMVGGADEISAMQYACYDALRGIQESKVKKGEAVTPRAGDGFFLGEGAGILIMERLQSAKKRGAKIYGLLKSGVITSGKGVIGKYEPDVEHMTRAIFQALSEANLRPSNIGQLNVSANFCKQLDHGEYIQLKEIFGTNIRISPLKYLMGEFGGAGIIRAAASLSSLYHNTPLPTVSLETLIRKTTQPVEWDTTTFREIKTALMTSSTFGGGSSCFVFTKNEYE
jgi:3-oxoacyl-[acyl-carrier-protein] synthase II